MAGGGDGRVGGRIIYIYIYIISCKFMSLQVCATYPVI